MRVLAIIPARSGSKGIPDKNVTLLGNKPLMNWTIDAAKQSKYINKIVVSTDSEKYALIATENGAETVIRDASISNDKVHSVYAVLDTLRKLEQHENYTPDIVLMLLPTSPLRQPNSIDKAIELYLENNPQSVISVTKSDKQLLHFRTINDAKYLEPVKKVSDYNVQRQDLEDLYELNGSIYVSSPATLYQKESFHISNGSLPLIMSKEESVDINQPEDMEYAEYLIRKQKA